MSFQDDLMRADAIREIRASGCTLPGVAELIVDFHGAVHVLTNVPKIQILGEEVAASDSEQGAKMRELLQEVAWTKGGGTSASDVLKQLMTKKDETQTSKPAESQAAADASAGIDAGSVSAAAASAGASGEAAAAAGNSADQGPGAAPETSVAQGEGQAQGS